MTTMELIEKGIGHNCLSDAYDLGKADADAFLKQWKDDTVESFAKYDANSVEEVYMKGRADATRWIPASERLPKDCEQVLVTFCHDLDGYWVATCVYYEQNPFWERVIAWMPLPQPYGEEQK